MQHLTRRGVCNCVDGEISPCEIIIEGDAKLHFGVTAIRAHVATKGRHFMHDFAALFENTYGAKGDADGDRTPMAKERTHLLWRGRRGEVPVQVIVAEQCVAHRSAHAPGFIASLLERPRDVEHRGRRRQRERKHGFRHRTASEGRCLHQGQA